MYTLLLTQGIYSVSRETAHAIRAAIEAEANVIDVDIAMLAGTPPRKVALVVSHVVALLEPHHDALQARPRRLALHAVASVSSRAEA